MPPSAPMKRFPHAAVSSFAAALLATVTTPARPSAADETTIRVYVLAGQSNLLEMGNVSGGNRRHSGFFLSADPDAGKGASVSVYEGPFDPAKDYDELKPIATGTVIYDGMGKDPFPRVDGEATWVARGFIEVDDTGEYEFSPGYGNSTFNVTEVDGREVYRREPGSGAPVRERLKLEGGKRYPFRTLFFTGAADSLFWVGRTDIPGTLDTVARQEKKFPWILGEDGNWAVRDDVFFHDARLHGGWGWEEDDPNRLRLDLARLKKPAVPLTVGKGVWIGLPFGFLLGDYHDEPVLLIRTAIGNRGLAWDFRPPSSGRLPDVPEDLKKWEGAEYRMMIDGVRRTLEHLPEILPGHREHPRYELAGFVWFQGHKDGGKPEWVDEYESNLVNLIRDVRSDLEAPALPVMIATVGFEGKAMPENYRKIREAQLAVGNPARHPEFAGTVKTVDTRDFWRPAEESPSGQGYHYNRNAETYLLIGQALGRGMIELLEAKK